MGCGSSKAVAVEPTANAPRIKIEPASVSVSPVAKANEVSPPTKVPTDAISDEDLNDDGATGDEPYITEKSKNANQVSDARPPTPDFCLEGKKVTSTGSATPDQGPKNTDEIVPIVQNRPSSRGGMAFDITYDQPNSHRMDKIKTRSTKKAKPELTITELQSKLEAAETRRKDTEQQKVQKMAKEGEKVQNSTKPANQPELTPEDRAEHFKILRNQMALKNDGSIKVSTPMA